PSFPTRRSSDLLFLAPGERRSLAVEKFRIEPDFIECRCQSILREITWHASGADAEIVAHRSFEHHRRLHDERDATPELAGIERSDVTAIESHRAGGGLAGTGGTAKHTRRP